MDLTTLILWAILGLKPEWQPTTCDHVFAMEGARLSCEARRDEGRAWAEELAGYVAEEATRFGLEDDWDWIVADLKREFDFSRGNACPARVRVANVVSREVMNEEVGRWKFCWTYTVHRDATPLRNCQPVLLLDEDEEYVYIDRCAYGETGLFQIRLHEIPDHADTDVNGDGEIDRGDGGYVLPWGDVIPQTSAGRLQAAHDPRTNVHLGLRTFANVRQECCCTTTRDETGLERTTCDETCEADVPSFLGAFNTGSCDGDAAERYVGRVNREREKAVEYVCDQFPEWEGCPVEE